MQQKSGKKIIAVTLLFLCIFLAVGCSLTMPAEQAEAIGYMNQKYGTRFSYVGTEDVFVYGSEKAYILSNENYPDEKIMIRYDTSTWQYGENFTDIYYKDQSVKIAEEFVDRIFPGAPCAVCIENYRELQEKQLLSFDEYMKINPPKFVAVVYYDCNSADVDELDELYRQIKDEIASSEYPLMKISIYTETDVQDLSAFNRTEVLHYRDEETYDVEITIDEMDFYSHNYK